MAKERERLSKIIGFYISEEMHNAILLDMHKKKLTLASWVREAIKEKLARSENGE